MDRARPRRADQEVPGQIRDRGAEGAFRCGRRREQGRGSGARGPEDERRPATWRRRAVSGRADQDALTDGRYRGAEGVARGGRPGLAQVSEQAAERRARRADLVDDPGVGRRAPVTGPPGEERVAARGKRRPHPLRHRRRRRGRPQGQSEVEDGRRRGGTGGGRRGRRPRGGGGGGGGGGGWRPRGRRRDRQRERGRRQGHARGRERQRRRRQGHAGGRDGQRERGRRQGHARGRDRQRERRRRQGRGGGRDGQRE